MAFVNGGETVVAFAILYVSVGRVSSACGVALMSPLRALYFSAITTATIGYGDYVPADDITRGLVLCEIFTGLVFLAFLLPALLSVFSAMLARSAVTAARGKGECREHEAEEGVR